MPSKLKLHSNLPRTRKGDDNTCHATGEKGREPKAELTAAELDYAALYRLMTWLSPAYPTGAFSYSGGIEWAVEAGDICDAATLRAWLAVMIGEGFAFSDAVFLTHAYRAAAEHEDNRLRAIAELAVAFAPSKERHLETTAQGLAFLDMTRATWPACALDRLSLLSAGSEPKVGALFAQAERNRSYCGQRDPILASTPKYKTLWKALGTRPDLRRIGR